MIDICLEKMNANNAQRTTPLIIFVNFAVALFFIATLAMRGGYNFAPVILMLLSLGYIIFCQFKKRPLQIPSEEKWLAWSYIFYFSLFVLSFFIYEGRPRELDNPSRIIFLLPLLFLFKDIPIYFKTLAWSIPLGAIAGGITACIDRFYLNANMAFSPRMMHIQGGDISMSFGIFSLVLGFHYMAVKNRKWAVICYLGAIGGVLGSILSTARGGWIGFPFILLFVFWIYRKQLSKKFYFAFFGVIFVGIITAFFSPETRMMERYQVAKQDIVDYFDNTNRSTSLGARFDMWKSAILMAQEKPILGWGVQGVSEKRKLQYEQGLISHYASQFNHAHSQFFDDLSKRGILGLLALLAVFLIPLRFFIRQLSTDNTALKCTALLGIVHIISVMFYCVSQGFFSHNSGNIFYFFLTIIFYAIATQLKHNKKDLKKQH